MPYSRIKNLKSIGSNTIVLLAVLTGTLAIFPSSACGCEEATALPILVKILLFVFYLLAAPIVLMATGADAKHIAVYFIVFAISCLTWFYHEFFVVALPTIPLVAMILLLRKNDQTSS